MSAQQILDTEQEAAYEADYNVVVSAGAGSGKTTVLSHRYVRLIQNKKLPVDAILTLTFTRKAAAEMFSRIHQELSKHKDPWVRQQLERFNTARIDTLDSFCASIVRGSCQNYGIPPNFTIDEGRLKNLAEQTALEFLMEHQTEPVLQELVATFSFDIIVKDFFADFCQHQLPIVQVPSYKDFARKQVDEFLSRINARLARLSAICSAGASLDTSTKHKTLLEIKAIFSNYQNCPRAYPEQEQEYDYLINLCKDITAIRKPSKVTPGTEMARAKELFSEGKDICVELTPLLVFYNKRGYIERIGELLDELAQRFNRNKRNEGLLSFGDLIDLAVDILKTSLPLRTYYKQQIRAIMIDEFQDNNEKQKDLLYLLAEAEYEASHGIPSPEQLAPDKLFFVGDEKQSIYRFRGADVSVFKRLSEELSHQFNPQHHCQLSISTNYRSEPELIDFFNQLFPGIFGTPSEPYEAAYTQARATPKRERSGTIPVELFINTTQLDEEISQEETSNEQTEPSQYCSPSETEAIAVAQRIIQGIEKKEFQFSDVALLFRTTTHQSVYERVFRTVGIPFVSADPRGLFVDAPANDIYAFLQLVVSPQDTNAYATVLRSPFVNISDHTFLKLMLQLKDNLWYEPFSELSEDFWTAEYVSDRDRYNLGAELYDTLLHMADIKGIAELVAWLWYESGYRTSLLQDSDMAATLGHFDLLYDMALKADQRHLTLAAFLDELAPLIGNPEKVEGDETDTRADAVIFMTIHKSKGLQFPVVIVPQAGSEGQSFRNDKPYFYSTTFGPVISWKPYSKHQKDKLANPLFEELRETENRQNLAELKRLFYVALTRAEQKVIIAGNKKINQDKIDETRSLYNGNLSDLQATLFATPKPDKKKQSFLELISLGIDQVSQTLYTLQSIQPLTIAERGKELARLKERAKKRAGLSDEALQLQQALSSEKSFYNQPAISIPRYAPRITSPTIMEETYQKARSTNISEEGALPLPTLTVDHLIASSKNDLETLFGTLCHTIIQHTLEGKGMEPPRELLAEFKTIELSKEHQKLFIEEAQNLAQQFLKTEYGKAAFNAKPKLRTEYSFLLPLQNSDQRPILVKGSIDLIYETENHCVIIDFKTDKTLQPEIHRIQLECYHRAGKAFSDKPVKTLLVYLRSMNTIEIKPILSDAKLYSIAQGATDAT
ncbi:UvrD-helicase domain-containing protein [Gracilinema caldarium]|uniref:DNA 3'-5' helicase n=1 Tax=Gracilinema caldarium (strain ATCC 51460 / DSM 7334 / H1) TaxID=744872 RepID=F8EY76_GRAC1|nr:UvrD-helicase domain-containing protein [Gracilinema caldarium]AEJ18235.1 UvrD/REP helicase [Gracilinema caldarium DSM 7334]